MKSKKKDIIVSRGLWHFTSKIYKWRKIREKMMLEPTNDSPVTTLYSDSPILLDASEMNNAIVGSYEDDDLTGNGIADELYHRAKSNEFVHTGRSSDPVMINFRSSEKHGYR